MIESFATDDEIQTMTKRMEQLVDEFDPSSTASIFSTKNQVTYFSFLCLNFSFFLSVLIFFIDLFQQQLTDDYFFESAERVSFFFEGIEEKNHFFFWFCCN